MKDKIAAVQEFHTAFKIGYKNEPMHLAICYIFCAVRSSNMGCSIK